MSAVSTYLNPIFIRYLTAAFYGHYDDIVTLYAGASEQGKERYTYLSLVEEGDIAYICTPRVDRSNEIISTLNA